MRVRFYYKPVNKSSDAGGYGIQWIQWHFHLTFFLHYFVKRRHLFFDENKPDMLVSSNKSTLYSLLNHP